MGNCKDCEWWVDAETPIDLGGHYKGKHQCALARMRYFDPAAPLSLALADFDGEYGNGDLWTSPGFGCVQFRVKGDADEHGRDGVAVY